MRKPVCFSWLPKANAASTENVKRKSFLLNDKYRCIKVCDKLPKTSHSNAAAKLQ